MTHTPHNVDINILVSVRNDISHQKFLGGKSTELTIKLTRDSIVKLRSLLRAVANALGIKADTETNLSVLELLAVSVEQYTAFRTRQDWMQRLHRTMLAQPSSHDVGAIVPVQLRLYSDAGKVGPAWHAWMQRLFSWLDKQENTPQLRQLLFFLLLRWPARASESGMSRAPEPTGSASWTSCSASSSFTTLCDSASSRAAATAPAPAAPTTAHSPLTMAACACGFCMACVDAAAATATRNKERNAKKKARNQANKEKKVKEEGESKR